MRYRVRTRGFELARIEEVVRYSMERYVDEETGSLIAVGKHGPHLMMVAYEASPGLLTPVTVHMTERRQIESRLRSGRFRHE